MSNGVIRSLFEEKLKFELFKLGVTKLKYPLLIQGINVGKPQLPTTDHIVTHLIPAPAYSETLSGDHTSYTGIYQLTLNANVNNGGVSSVEDMTDVIQNIFRINTRLTSASGDLTVQVISPLKSTEGRVTGEGSKWWTIHTYFDYRADIEVETLPII